LVSFLTIRILNASGLVAGRNLSRVFLARLC